MPRGPRPLLLALLDAAREALQPPARRPQTAQALALRARIVLACSEQPARSHGQTAQELGVHRATVGIWRRRYAERGLNALLDEPRPGAPHTITDADIEHVITRTLESQPEDATHGSTRGMAKASGMSQGAIRRIWRAFALHPHRSEMFQLSRDPFFIETVRDIVGLCLAPPDRALVLCVDEKPQIQALEPTAPVLPMRPGQAERRTHDDVRHATLDLFAALDGKAGTVIAQCQQRHRSVEFRAFLDRIDPSVPPELDVHLILDNSSTHKTALIHNWLAKRPRYHVQFTPTRSSWLTRVAVWFALLTSKQLKRGVHPSTDALEQAIQQYVAATNEHPRPFVWTKSADEILQSVTRFCQRTSTSGH